MDICLHVYASVCVCVFGELVSYLVLTSSSFSKSDAVFHVSSNAWLAFNFFAQAACEISRQKLVWNWEQKLTDLSLDSNLLLGGNIHI